MIQASSPPHTRSIRRSVPCLLPIAGDGRAEFLEQPRVGDVACKSHSEQVPVRLPVCDFEARLRPGIDDVRLDKAFDMGRYGRLTPTLDIFNLLNSGVPTTVRTTNTATAPFREVTAILSPRVVRFGFRFNF